MCMWEGSGGRFVMTDGQGWKTSDAQWTKKIVPKNLGEIVRM